MGSASYPPAGGSGGGTVFSSNVMSEDLIASFSSHYLCVCESECSMRKVEKRHFFVVGESGNPKP